MLETVKVPKEYEPVFQKAQDYVKRYFKDQHGDSTKGTIKISGERYLLIRAASMSIEFFKTVEDLYKSRGKKEALNVTRQLLFDVAHAIGKQDARNFHNKMGLKDPVEKLSAGPLHFAYCGWALVDILPESKLAPNKNYYLIYDHPFSFESSAWLEAAKKSDFPVCVMNAGYSSGWCEESFNVSLVASEIMCKAKGDEACRFIMAHPSKIEGYIKDYIKKKPILAKKITAYEIPGFFKRKKMEEEREKVLGRLKESEEKFRALAESSNDMIMRFDRQFECLYANSFTGQQVGIPAQRCIGKTSAQLSFPRQLAKKLEDTIKKVFVTKKPQRMEFILPNETWFDWYLFPEFSSDKKEVKGVIACARDITKLKQAEKELIKTHKQLEDAKRLSDIGTLAATVAHELRSPLGVIRAAAYNIKIKSKGAAAFKSHLANIDKKISESDQIIKNLLNYSRIRMPQYENISCDKALTEALAAIKHKYFKWDVVVNYKCNYGGSDLIEADPVHISELYSNIIDNAYQSFPDKCGSIEIEGKYDSKNNGLSMIFKDNGTGIAEEDLPKVFEPFFTRKSKGIGLGLTVCKQLANLHNGTINIQSKKGRGTIVTLVLPIARS